MINALNFLALLMILHYSLTILNINANALSLIFFINANTLIVTIINSAISNARIPELLLILSCIPNFFYTPRFSQMDHNHHCQFGSSFSIDLFNFCILQVLKRFFKILIVIIINVIKSYFEIIF